MLNFYFEPRSVCVSEISLYMYNVVFPDPVGSKLTCVTMLYIHVRTIKPVFPTSVSLQWDGVSPWRQGEDWMQLVVSLLSDAVINVSMKYCTKMSYLFTYTQYHYSLLYR